MNICRPSIRGKLAYALTPLALLGSVAMATAGTAENVSFNNQTVTMMINLPVGSTAELFHSQVAPFIARNLPGTPQMIVDSKPGGAGALGAAYFSARVKTDGLTLGVLALVVQQWAVGRKLPVELANFEFVGAFGQSTVVLSNAKSGPRSAMQFKDPPAELFVGASAPQAPGVVPLRLFLHALGGRDRYQLITGYSTQGDMLQALRTGEINVTFQGMSAYSPRAEGYRQEGIVRPLMEYGVLGQDGADVATAGPNLPLLEDVWQKVAPETVGGPEYAAWRMMRNANQLNFLYVLPPGTPEKLVTVWNDAIVAAYKDPELLALLARQDIPPPSTVNRTEARALFSEVIDAREKSDVQKALKPIVGSK